MTAGGSLTLPDQQLGDKDHAQQLILEFQELKRTAERDLSTLNTLESSLLSLQLEQARQTDPWELISTPTLLDQPIAPRKKRMVALGFIVGFVIACVAALIKDRRSDLVFSEDELKNLLPCPLLKNLSVISSDTWTDAADLLASGLLSKFSSSSSIALIPIGKIPNDQVQALSAELNRALRGRDLVVSNDLRETSKCATQLLLAAPGAATRADISQFCQKLALQQTPLSGWCFLNKLTVD